MQMSDHKSGHWLPVDQAETLRGKDTDVPRLVPPQASILSRLRFRNWGEQDAPQFRAMLDDADLWRFMHEEYPGTITDDLAATLIELSRQAGHHKVRAVEFDGQLIGQARMQWHSATTPPQSGEVSYWLARAHWGKGLAAPMVAVFIWRCFSMFPALSRITARIHRDNTASHRVVDRLGFRLLEDDLGDGWQSYALDRADGIDLSRVALPDR